MMSLALLTDFYQLTMAYGYWKTGTLHKEALFHLFFRRKPFQQDFAIAAGLEAVIDFIEKFSYDRSDLEYLASLNTFEKPFLDYLASLKLQVDLDALPEGTLCSPDEALIRVQGPLLHCQLLESPLLNLINFPTLIATKAARVCLAARGDPVIEFGMRRAQGIDGAITASRAAFIGGCVATSHVLAGKLFGIPVRGTHAHSWIMSFDTELESFYAYAKTMPEGAIFLVDTYDTVEGVKHAIEVGKWLKSQGKTFGGVRLDSGDLFVLGVEARKLLDDAGFEEAKIFASNELDEDLIAELKRKGSPITIWGVGTHLVTGQQQPALDGIYKLTAVRGADGEWKQKKKLSLHKHSLPDLQGKNLVPIFRKGKLVYKKPTLIEIQEKAKQGLREPRNGSSR